MNKNKSLFNTLKISIASVLLGSFTLSAQAQTIPAGTVLNGALAQTLYVSTSDKGTSAALIHITGKGVTPNGSVFSLSNCDVYGKATADQQSERISIMPVVLACRDSKGATRTTGVTGTVTDQKGKNGLAAQFLTLPTQEIATVNAGTPLSVIFTNSFRLNQ